MGGVGKGKGRCGGVKKCGRVYGVSMEGVVKCVGVWGRSSEGYGGCEEVWGRCGRVYRVSVEGVGDDDDFVIFILLLR